MMIIRRTSVLIVGLMIILFSCNKNSISSEQEYLRWLNNEENNIIKHKYINDFKISLKYLPPEYNAFKELKSKENYTKKEIDSLVNYYSKSLSFTFSIAPADEKSSKNIMYYDVFDKKAFIDRVQELNFRFSSYFTLTYNEEEYLPVLYIMENTYELSNARNFYFVFMPDDMNYDDINELEIIYDDQLFDLGKLKFNFRSNDIKNIPNINFWNL